MSDKINRNEMSQEEMDQINGGVIVDDGDGEKFWLVR